MSVIQFNFSTYLKYVFVLLYAYVWRLECMYVHNGPAEIRRGARSLILELHTVVSCHRGPGN